MKVNVIFDDEEGTYGGNDSDDAVKDDIADDKDYIKDEQSPEKGVGYLEVNIKSKNKKDDVDLVVMPTSSKCGINSYSLENQCATGNLWKSARFECHDGNTFEERPAQCMEPTYFETLSQKECLNRCSKISELMVVSPNKNISIVLAEGHYKVVVRSKSENYQNIGESEVHIKEGGKETANFEIPD